ncbi:HNH endonuclease [Salipaludibacillus sp. HK11]|uniref:HNH endonuclease n=1 Tax=Salipaludibacillus sp. HK11 TaxID=3394320 RepID=UPI0039FC6BBD
MATNKNTWEGNEAIQLASQVILELDNINELNIENWIFYNDIDVMDFCAKPKKFTLLNEYITEIYIFGYEYLLDKHFPMSVINSLTNILEFYRIDFSSVGECEFLGSDDNDLTGEEFEQVEDYAKDLFDFFIPKLSSVIVHETFTILYMNKTFLFEFNSQLAEVIREFKVTNYPTQLKKDGVINRTYFPEWLKKGIKFRDRGRCQICGTDLTRIFQNDNAENYDHIIPLELHGSNDPTNIQLTCEGCNKSKGARNTEFINSFSAFWNL